jgi:hypothetical protein
MKVLLESVGGATARQPTQTFELSSVVSESAARGGETPIPCSYGAFRLYGRHMGPQTGGLTRVGPVPQKRASRAST